MPAYVIVEVEILKPERYEEYKQIAAPTVHAYDGTYIVRGGEAELLEGEVQPKRIVVLRFPSVERAKEWWSCEAYRPGRDLRQQIAKTRMIVVEGMP
jgi:uncharacterized protein (DUF1330 family)